MNTALKKFLGVDRWRCLFVALREQSSRPLDPLIGLGPQIVAVLVAVTPVAITFGDNLRPSGDSASTLPTVAFGICAVLALLCRSRLGLTPDTRLGWRQALSLTHTAVALGCVPAAIILGFSHSLLADRHDVLSHAVAAAPSGEAPLLHVTRFVLLIAIAAWVALTEELIFRGLLVAVIRRSSLHPTQRLRDIGAVVVSAALFGFAHWPTWGPLPALALVGLGIGFVLAFIANGERLGPIIAYHFAFDLLSLTISTW